MFNFYYSLLVFFSDPYFLRETSFSPLVLQVRPKKENYILFDYSITNNHSHGMIT